MDIFDLQAILSLNKDDFDQGLSEAENDASSFGSKLGTVAKGAAAGVTAITGATAAVGAAFVKGAGDVAAYGDDIEKTSQKMGFSFQGYQEWDAIMEHNGSSIKSVRTAMQTLSKQVDKNSDAFAKLGISEQELANMNQEELFEKVISGLQDMGEGTERTALATELLGRGSKELGPLLNMTSEETEKMRQRVHELGGVMSDDAVKASAAYQDSLQDMTTAIDGVKRNIMSEFLPSITGVMDGLGNLFSGDKETGLGQIKEGVSQFIENLSQAIPQVIEVGTSIIMSLGSAIVQNLPAIFNAGVQAILQLASGIGDSLPQLIPSAVDAILTLVEGLLDNIDKLIDAGLKLMVGLAEGLIKAIPRIVQKIPTIIAKIVTALVNSVPKIATAGVTLLSSLVKNLPTIIANVVKAIPSVIAGIAKAIVEGVPSIIKAGMDLMGGLGKGLIDGVGNAINAAKNAAGSVIGSVKRFFGIASPSKVFAQIGGFLDDGLAQGILNNLGVVEDAVDDVNDALYYDAGVPTESMDTDTSVMTSSAGGDYFTVPRSTARDLTVILELDRMQLGRAVYRLNDEETQRVGVRLAGGFA